jgi:hypothetical protein
MPTVSVRHQSEAPRRAVDPASRRLNRYLAAGLFGLVFIMIGLATDMLLHAADPDLAGEEGLFTLRNPGHIFLGLGIALTAGGLSGAASALLSSRDRPPRALRAGALALRVGILGLVIALIYIGTGPGFGHDHGAVAAGTELSDGTRLSSSTAAEVDRSRLPADQAAALAALSWSREGFVDLRAHDHGDDEGPTPEPTPEEQVILDGQLATAYDSVVPKYPTPAEAEADGYVQAAPSVNGVGAHWVKWSLVDKPFDPAQPSMLLFEEIKYGEGPALVGLSYWVMSEDEPEGFAGDSDVWHGHTGLCFENGWLTVEDLPERNQCPGDWINGSDLWMLHVWILPELQSRYGIFSAVNPRLCERSC